MTQYMFVSIDPPPPPRWVRPKTRDLVITGVGIVLGVTFVLALWGVASGFVRGLVPEQSEASVRSWWEPLMPSAIDGQKIEEAHTLKQRYRELAEEDAAPPLHTDQVLAGLDEQLPGLECDSTVVAELHETQTSLVGLSYAAQVTAVRTHAEAQEQQWADQAQRFDQLVEAVADQVPQECPATVPAGFRLPHSILSTSGEEPSGALDQWSDLLEGMSDQWLRVWIYAENEHVAQLAEVGLWESENTRAHLRTR